jgi:hypothetical protein
MAAVVGPMADVESMVCLKDLFNSLGSEDLHTEQPFPMSGAGTDLRSSYILNSGIAGIEVGVAWLRRKGGTPNEVVYLESVNTPWKEQ